MRKKILLGGVLCFCLCLAGPGLQGVLGQEGQTKTEQENLQHEVRVTLKLIQVYVTDEKGNPVTDLTPGDFVVNDNGTPQKITDFERHTLSPPPQVKGEETEEKEKVPVKRLDRKFFLFIDMEGNGVRGLKKAKETALNFMDTQIKSADQVSVLSYSHVSGLVLHSYLSKDHDKTRKIIEDLTLIPGFAYGGYLVGEASWRPSTDGITIIAKNMEQSNPQDNAGMFGYRSTVDLAGKIAQPTAPPGRQETTARVEENPLVRMQQRDDVWNSIQGELKKRSDASFQRVFLNKFMREMIELARAFRYIPGNKNILLFSAGFTEELLLKDHAFRKNFQEMSRELGNANAPVYTVNTATSLTSLQGEASRSDHSLEYLAENSGGKFFGNIDDYENVLEEIQKVTSNYYVLGYYVNLDWSGSYHHLDVRVKREGVKVYAQGGYFNPKPYAEFTDFEKRLHLIDLALSEEPQFQIPQTFSLTAIPYPQGDRNVLLLAEADRGKLEQVLFHGSEVYTLVFDGLDNLVYSTRGEAKLPNLPDSRFRFGIFVPLNPGLYKCRIIFRNKTTGAAAVAGCSVALPSTEGAKLTLFAPLLFVPGQRGKFLDIPSEKKGVGIFGLENILPEMFSEYVPVVEGVKRGTEKVYALVRISIGDIPDPEIDLSAYLADMDAGMRLAVDAVVLGAVPENEHTDILLVEISCPELAPGKYDIILKAEENSTKTASEAQSALFVK
ncbi:MAG: VWA domain-containing protein [Candidatus Aminicenantes bacterium]|nr:VWA domain-containing protein [Candidatus Aminicenantes bacterium]